MAFMKQIPLISAIGCSLLSSCFVPNYNTAGTESTRKLHEREFVTTMKLNLTRDFDGSYVATPSDKDPWSIHGTPKLIDVGTGVRVSGSATRLLPSGQYWLLRCRTNDGRIRFLIEEKDFNRVMRPEN